MQHGRITESFLESEIISTFKCLWEQEIFFCLWNKMQKINPFIPFPYYPFPTNLIRKKKGKNSIILNFWLDKWIVLLDCLLKSFRLELFILSRERMHSLILGKCRPHLKTTCSILHDCYKKENHLKPSLYSGVADS